MGLRTEPGTKKSSSILSFFHELLTSVVLLLLVLLLAGRSEAAARRGRLARRLAPHADPAHPLRRPAALGPVRSLLASGLHSFSRWQTSERADRWSYFYRDDDWRGPNQTDPRFPGQVFRSSGACKTAVLSRFRRAGRLADPNPQGIAVADTPVFPPAWSRKDHLWMVWTQCCPFASRGYNCM